MYLEIGSAFSEELPLLRKLFFAADEGEGVGGGAAGKAKTTAEGVVAGAEPKAVGVAADHSWGSRRVFGDLEVKETWFLSTDSK
jgi:hypothetical protein